ncbi:MAG: hypothetical protein EOO70_06865 [Myxococcaceae bacterium]|nr:MAG: hypothetical protein EOO70_06865 [Myxococcaceae bacterium]
MRQSIYEDPHGVAVWDQEDFGRVYVHLCNAEQWTAITGEEAPALPREVEEYLGPWYAMDDGKVPAVPGSDTLNSVSSVGELDAAAPQVVVIQPKVPKATKHAVHDGDR